MFFIFFITVNSLVAAFFLRLAYLEHRSEKPNKTTLVGHLIVAALNSAAVVVHIVGLSFSP